MKCKSWLFILLGCCCPCLGPFPVDIGAFLCFLTGPAFLCLDCVNGCSAVLTFFLWHLLHSLTSSLTQVASLGTRVVNVQSTDMVMH
jgi:hypothetical protein